MNANNCLICGSETILQFRVDQYPIDECSACRHKFVRASPTANHISEVYSDSYFTSGGAGYENYVSESELLRDHGRRYGRLLQRYMPLGKLLDVGSAAGFILEGLRDAGWQGVGVEPNATMVEYARNRHLDIICDSLENANITGQFDLVTMIQVIAHFIDPRLAVAKAAALLRAKGCLLVETWNSRSWTARLMGHRWHEYSPPSVLHFFTPDSLRELAGRCGLQQVAVGRPSKFLSGAHAKSLLRYKAKTSAIGKILATAGELFPDNVNIPYPSEDLFWALYKKS